MSGEEVHVREGIGCVEASIERDECGEKVECEEKAERE